MVSGGAARLGARGGVAVHDVAFLDSANPQFVVGSVTTRGGARPDRRPSSARAPAGRRPRMSAIVRSKSITGATGAKAGSSTAPPAGCDNVHPRL